MPPARRELSNRYCFTLNNPTEIPLPEPPVRISYLVYQLETGEAGTPHLQGYLEVSGSRMAFTTIQRQYPCLSRARLARARGSAEQNRIYCTKEPRLDGPWTTGTPAPDAPGSGHRSDLDAAMLAIREGMTDFEMHTDFAQVLAQYPRVKKVLKFINVTC